MSPVGTLFGVGAGPGAPDLITLRGLEALRSAPVLAYPAPEHGASLTRAIVAPHLADCAEGKVEIAVRMPMVAARFPAQEVYDRAAAEIGAHLEAGRDVAYLCEGDPFFYGSFSFLYQRMADRYPVRVIPGVSSLTACAAVLGAPLAARDDVLAILPATLPASVLSERLRRVEAAALIKVGGHLAKVRAVLASLGLEARARYVEHATMASERRMALADVDDGWSAPYFSMVLVHRGRLGGK